ncbi:MAG: helix-turn-helix domain-containing protein [Planctomycetes bacterium]|nr:helix-turn-helix domain-containing protein [Planctomycetota bacterium]
MANKKQQLQHINRRLTEEERRRHAEIRAAAEKDFPPKRTAKRRPAAGVAAQIRAAREARGLTWYALAKLAGVPNQKTIREIEAGGDATLSNIETLAKALGLRLELIESSK